MKPVEQVFYLSRYSSHQRQKLTYNFIFTHLLVAHHQNFQFFDIVDEELLEASGQHVLGLLVTTITNVWHQHLALESPADPVVNTSRLPPVFLQKQAKTN